MIRFAWSDIRYKNWECTVYEQIASQIDTIVRSILCKVTEGGSGHTTDFLLFSNLLLTRLQPRRVQRWGTCMDLPQLGPVAVLFLKSRKLAACPETPSVTLLCCMHESKLLL